jgi:hypothetical protein
VCKICNIPGHFISDCPNIEAVKAKEKAEKSEGLGGKEGEAATEGEDGSSGTKRSFSALSGGGEDSGGKRGTPPAGYICKRCGIEGHFVQASIPFCHRPFRSL